MKNLRLLVWLTQLGLSVALPPLGLVLLSVWLRDSFGWGNWVIWAGVVLGIIFALDGLRISLKTMEKMSAEETDKEPPVSFNDHQ